MQSFVMPLGFILFLFAETFVLGQGSPVPISWADQVPNISIRVDMTGSTVEQRGLGGADSPALTVRRTGRPNLTITPRAGSQKTVAATTASQFVTVANGQSGSILVARRVPYLEWLTTFGRDWAPPRDGFDFKFDEVGAYLNVHAQTGGTPSKPWVYITLTPELRGTVDGRAERVSFTRASTRVVAGHGRTLPVAAAGRTAAFFGMFMNDSGPGGRAEPVTISVTPTLMFKPAPDAGGPRKVQLRPQVPPVETFRITRPDLPEIPTMRLPAWAK